MTRNKISNSDDIIDFRNLTDRIEELEDDGADESREELATLRAFLDQCEDSGGDHQWRGTWYPGSAIRDSYFRDYAQQFADDIGAIDSNAGWPNNCIDWDRAARELQHDYTSVEFGDVTYWVRR